MGMTLIVCFKGFLYHIYLKMKNYQYDKTLFFTKLQQFLVPLKYIESSHLMKSDTPPKIPFIQNCFYALLITYIYICQVFAKIRDCMSILKLKQVHHCNDMYIVTNCSVFLFIYRIYQIILMMSHRHL